MTDPGWGRSDAKSEPAVSGWGGQDSGSGSSKDWNRGRQERGSNKKKRGNRDQQKSDDTCGLTVVTALGTVSALALLIQEGLTHVG